MTHLRAAALGLGLIAITATAPLAQEQPSDAERAAIEGVVRDLLQREPEIVFEALNELQRREEARTAEAQQNAIKNAAERLQRDPRDPVLGVKDGDVTVVEFFDYRCGYCRSMVPDLAALRQETNGVSYVMKEFPILGPESVLASKAALAAERQGAYPGFHEGLMKATAIDDALIERLAAEHGLDYAKLEEDMESPEIVEHLADNQNLARELGIGGTPAFVVGGQLVPGAVPKADLARLIEEARASEG